MKIKHVGASPHRLKSNPIEAVFAAEWEKQNTPAPSVMSHGTLKFLLCSKGNGLVTRALSQAEATAAATAVQWLGSPVGFSWLKDTLQKAGYEVIESASAAKDRKR